MELIQMSAIVTGAGSGIGREIALLFAEEGAKVTAADVNHDAATKVSLEISDRGGSSIAVAADVSKSADAKAIVSAAVQAFGSLNILVNCAGIGMNASLLETTDDLWDRVLDINLKGQFLCTREAARVMIEQGQGGSVVNIGSTAGDNARVGGGAYCASKAGVIQLTRVMAMELGPYGINANVVSPSLTDFSTGLNPKSSSSYRKAFIEQIPLGRAAQALDVAGAVVFLASEKARFISGEVVHVDGGYSAGKLTVRHREK